ncbi:MAG: 50S ribosomal protein L24 [Spirochaetia bacterium]|nr:50S ribosomal protein L24 [Spirochaetia bacterium]
MKKENTKKISTRIKVNDEVIVIAGKNRKQRGKVLAINKNSGRVIVQGVNLRKRFARPTQENPKGGIIEVEASLHISNIQYYDSKEKKGTKIKMNLDKSGKKVRVAALSGREID